jgi:hypothetical protein
MEKTFSRHYSKRFKIFVKSYKSVAMRARTLAARAVFKTPIVKLQSVTKLASLKLSEKLSAKLAKQGCLLVPYQKKRLDATQGPWQAMNNSIV